MEQQDVLDGIAGIFTNPSGVNINGFQSYSDVEDDDEYNSLYEESKRGIKMPSAEELLGEGETKKSKVRKATPPPPPIDEEDEEEKLEDEEEEQVVEKRKPGRPRKEAPSPPRVSDEPEDEDEEDPTPEYNEQETSQVSLLFNAVAEGLGLELDEDVEAPKDAEGLVDYLIQLIQEESVPTYASEEVKQLDEFVRNGGKVEDYFGGISSEINLDTIDISNETNQRRVVRELLLEKGFSEAQINKKIDKYVDAEILEDEALDALESLKEIKETKKEELLDSQRKQKEANLRQQQQFVDDVVSGIKGLDNYRGIPVPKKDKEALLSFILKQDAEGKTEFQKKYSEKPIDNLLYVAYSLMKGDALTDTAQRMGKTSALKALKQSLNSPVSGGNRIKGSSDNQLFSRATQIFRQLN